MKSKNIIWLGLGAIAAYFIFKPKKQVEEQSQEEQPQDSQGEGGGGGGGGAYPPPAPITPTPPAPNPSTTKKPRHLQEIIKFEQVPQKPKIYLPTIGKPYQGKFKKDYVVNRFVTFKSGSVIAGNIVTIGIFSRGLQVEVNTPSNFNKNIMTNKKINIPLSYFELPLTPLYQR